LFLDDTLEVDVSIAKGSIFGIWGSDKSLSQPENGSRMSTEWWHSQRITWPEVGDNNVIGKG